MGRRAKKIILWSLGGLLVAGATVAGGLWYLMQQPFYRPGVVRAEVASWEATLSQRGDASDEAWTVAPGIRLHHFASGTGRNVLVVHGGPGMPFREPMAGLEPLTDRFRFHYYDQRGCGRSTRPIERLDAGSFYEKLVTLEKTLGLGAQIADIERIRRILGDERLALVGHSFGAFAAALYAAELPEHVAGLVLVAPASVLVMPSEQGELFGAVRDKMPAEMRADYEAFLADYLDFGRLFERTEQETAALNGRFVRFYVAAAQARGFDVEASGVADDIGGFMVQAQYVSMGRRHDYRDALNVVRCPTVVVHGANDLQSEAASREYVEAIPSARLEVIEGAGHMAFAERPERFAEVVGALLESVAP